MGYPHFTGDCDHSKCITTNDLAKQRDWSAQTFGPGVRKGVVEHIKKELKEIEESGYTDTEEWIDVLILAIDGAWRGGASPEEIIKVLKEKWEKNFNRTWPDWRTASSDLAIEHVR